MLLNLLYAAVLLVASPWLLYASLRHGKYRHGWREKLFGAIELPAARGPRLWLHAVSVGEVNLLVGMCEALQRQHPELDLVVSCTTSTGHQLARQRFGDDRVFYCPLDFTWAVRRALRRVEPAMVVLAELEVWPNLIAHACRQKVPVSVINGRLSDSSFRGYRRAGRLLRPTFSRLARVAVQDAVYGDRFAQLGTPAERIHVTGSIKFDQAPLKPDQEGIERFRQLVGARPDHRIWVAGSTQSGEEQIVLDAFRQLVPEHPTLRLILVPRHAERFEDVAKLISGAGLSCWRRSQAQLPEPAWPADRVVLVDTIGELRTWWGLADVAFVGGSLGNRGGQNMLEPAAYGAAVCFGPNTRNFKDIVRILLDASAAAVVADQPAMVAYLKRMLEHPDEARAQGTRARRAIADQRGATQATIAHLVAQLHTGDQDTDKSRLFSTDRAGSTPSEASTGSDGFC